MLLTQYVVKIIIKKYRYMSSFLMTLYSLTWVYQNLLNQSSMEGHLVLDSCNNEHSSCCVCVPDNFVYLSDYVPLRQYISITLFLG